MKIAILGTRGIPNNYGGFEQCAEYLAKGLVERGHKVVVYSPSFQPYAENLYKGIHIKKIFSPEHGFTGNIVLKEAEGIFSIMKKRGLLDDYFKRFNYETYGGTPVLGLNKTVIIGHGVSNEIALRSINSQ